MHGGLDMEEEEEAKSEGEEAIVEGRGEGPRQISNGSRTPRKSGRPVRVRGKALEPVCCTRGQASSQAHARSDGRWSDRRRGDRTREQSHGQSEVPRREPAVDRFE